MIQPEPQERILPLLSEVSRSSVVAPITTMSPSQRLVLWPASLASLRVDLALELRRSATSNVRVQFLAVLDVCS